MPLFDELLVKIAEGKKLDAGELDSFRQNAQALSDVMEFVGDMKTPGFTYIKNLRLDSSGIEADGTILHPFVAEKAYHATDTDILNGTFTAVTFNNNKYGNSNAFRLGDDNIKIYLLTKAKAFFVTLSHAWSANAVGSRRVDFQYYDNQGSLMGTALLSVMPSAGIEEDWFTATRLADLPDGTEYIKCRVKQTSGGTLKLVYFAVDLHVI